MTATRIFTLSILVFIGMCVAGSDATSNNHLHHGSSGGSQRSNMHPERPWGVRQRPSAPQEPDAEETNFALYRIRTERDVLQMRATSFAFRRYQPQSPSSPEVSQQTELEFLESSSYPGGASRGKVSYSCS
jgi:hypothetical protein